MDRGGGWDVVMACPRLPTKVDRHPPKMTIIPPLSESRNRNRQQQSRKFALDLDPLSDYISVFHGHSDAPGLFHEQPAPREPNPIMSILDVLWRIYSSELGA